MKENNYTITLYDLRIKCFAFHITQTGLTKFLTPFPPKNLLPIVPPPAPPTPTPPLPITTKVNQK